MSKPETTAAPNFLRQIVQADLDAGKHAKIVTRFPPEPNGYLHIGHAKSICLNFGLAQEFAGDCHLRFDDTNPAKEDQEYIDAIEADIKWLGFQWSGEVCYASNYFDQLHAWAIELIKAGKAFVCDLGPEEMREYRGTLTEPGRNSPYRDRSVEENLDLFARMKAGEFPDGTRSLRAKIDMGSPNMNLRDPILYRIRHAHHHQTGDKWCIYRATTSPTVSRTPSRASPIRSAPWNSKTIVRSTSGSWPTCRYLRNRASTNSPGST